MADVNPSTAKKSKARVARFFYDGMLSANIELTLPKQASHHLSTVLRSKHGDAVVLFNGDGYNYHATIVSTGQRGSSKHTVIQIHGRQQGICESPLHITLVQCVSKPERMDICLRQAIELGVNTIQPVFSRHSIKVQDQQRLDKKHLHWGSIVVSACEQSGRARLPSLNDAMSYAQYVESLRSAKHPVFVLDPLAQHSLTEAAIKLKNVAHAKEHADSCAVAIIIGPETGLDEHEIRASVEAGAVPVHIGKRVLRTETAGPTCITLLQSLLGDLQPS